MLIEVRLGPRPKYGVIYALHAGAKIIWVECKLAPVGNLMLSTMGWTIPLDLVRLLLQDSDSAVLQSTKIEDGGNRNGSQ